LPFENQPKIIGGYDTFRKRIEYPELAVISNLEGRGVIRILVNEKGIPVKFDIIKDIGGGCAEEVISTLKKTRFKPAMQRDKPVKFWMNIPVDFNLIDENK